MKKMRLVIRPSLSVNHTSRMRDADSHSTHARYTYDVWCIVVYLQLPQSFGETSPSVTRPEVTTIMDGFVL